MSKNILNLYFDPLIIKLADAVRRFPLAVIFCCCLYAGLASDYIEPDSEIVIALVLGFLWSVTARLITENYTGPKYIDISMGLAGYILFACWAHHNYLNHHYYTLSQTFIFAFSSMFVLPFINRTRTEEDFWNFNYTFWKLLISGFLISIVFFAAGSAILAVIRFMTGIAMPFSGLFMLTECLFGPLFVLANLPKNLSHRFSSTERFFNAECNIQAYLIIPLFLIYGLIFYLYAGSIIVRWTLPEGSLAYYIMGFGIVGIINYFMSFGFASEKPLLGFFRNNFFRLLFLPVILLALAVYQRIHAYGVTESRYTLALFCFFLTVSVGFHYSRLRANELRAMSCLFMVLLLMSVAGPISAGNISNRSQMARLEYLITKYDLVQEGRFASSKKILEPKDKKDLMSLVDYFVQPGKKHLIQKWVSLKPEQMNSYAVYSQLNIAAVYFPNPLQAQNPPPSAVPFSYFAKKFEKAGLSVSGYDYATDLINWYDENKPRDEMKIVVQKKGAEIPVTLNFTNEKFSLEKTDGKILLLDISAMAKPASDQELSLTAAGPWAELHIRFANLKGYYDKENKFHCTNFSGRILIKLK